MKITIEHAGTRICLDELEAAALSDFSRRWALCELVATTIHKVLGAHHGPLLVTCNPQGGIESIQRAIEALPPGRIVIERPPGPDPAADGAGEAGGHPAAVPRGDQGAAVAGRDPRGNGAVVPSPAPAAPCPAAAFTPKLSARSQQYNDALDRIAVRLGGTLEAFMPVSWCCDQEKLKDSFYLGKRLEADPRFIVRRPGPRKPAIVALRSRAPVVLDETEPPKGGHPGLKVVRPAHARFIDDAPRSAQEIRPGSQELVDHSAFIQWCHSPAGAGVLKEMNRRAPKAGDTIDIRPDPDGRKMDNGPAFRRQAKEIARTKIDRRWRLQDEHTVIRVED